MLQQRASHTATLLPDGTVLVTGGWIHFYTIASAELYDLTTEKWSSTGSLQTPRDDHTATLLRNGKVLVVGGRNLTESKPRQRFVYASAELYDPATKTWSTAGRMQTERMAHIATLLPDGRVLVVGGLAQRGNAATSAEIYDPTTEKWSITGSPQTHVVASSLLDNGKVLGVGDDLKPKSKAPATSAELYDPATGVWTRTAPPLVHLPSAPEGYYRTTLLHEGHVFLTEFFSKRLNSSPPVKAELYDPAAGTWTETGKEIKGRFAATTTLLPDGSVLICGGKYPYGNTLPRTGLPFNAIPVGETAEVYLAAIGSWIKAGNPATARFHHTATLLPNGKVLIAGGESYDNKDGGGPTTACELYDAPLAGHGRVPER